MTRTSAPVATPAGRRLDIRYGRSKTFDAEVREAARLAQINRISKNPPIPVSDATSALDSFTESQIEAALDRIARGRTTLVIAHRLSKVVNADEILVLDRG